MRKSFCITTAAAAALAFGISSASAQTVLFEEDFDDVADIAELLDKPGWTDAVGSPNNLVISSDQAFSEDNSLLQPSGEATSWIVANLGQGYVALDEGDLDGPILTSAWQYIEDATAAGDSTLTIAGWANDAWGDGGLQNFLVFGLYSFSPLSDHEDYAVRVVFGGENEGSPNQGWWPPADAANPEAGERIEGEWVHLAIWAQETEAQFFVNGEMYVTDTYDFAAWDSIRIGRNADGAPHATDVYWDDVQVVQGASAPEPVTVPEWHLY